MSISKITITANTFILQTSLCFWSRKRKIVLHLTFNTNNIHYENKSNGKVANNSISTYYR